MKYLIFNAAVFLALAYLIVGGNEKMVQNLTREAAVQQVSQPLPSKPMWKRWWNKKWFSPHQNQLLKPLLLKSRKSNLLRQSNQQHRQHPQACGSGKACP